MQLVKPDPECDPERAGVKMCKGCQINLRRHVNKHGLHAIEKNPVTRFNTIYLNSFCFKFRPLLKKSGLVALVWPLLPFNLGEFFTI